MTLNGAIMQLVELRENSMMPVCFKPYLDKVIETISECEEPSAQPEQRWIPVTERLPEEHDSFFAKLYGTDKWNAHMFRKTSDEVIVTTVFADGTKRTDTAYTHDGKWEFGIKAVQREVVAWMPLPEPYKEEGEADAETKV